MNSIVVKARIMAAERMVTRTREHENTRYRFLKDTRHTKGACAGLDLYIFGGLQGDVEKRLANHKYWNYKTYLAKGVDAFQVCEKSLGHGTLTRPNNKPSLKGKIQT